MNLKPYLMTYLFFLYKDGQGQHNGSCCSHCCNSKPEFFGPTVICQSKDKPFAEMMS